MYICTLIKCLFIVFTLTEQQQKNKNKKKKEKKKISNRFSMVDGFLFNESFAIND